MDCPAVLGYLNCYMVPVMGGGIMIAAQVVTVALMVYSMYRLIMGLLGL